MIIVAVSQRVDDLPERGERRDALDQRLSDFVFACGGLAVPVPNALVALGTLDGWLEVVRPRAIILSGGNDIGTCADRDRTERLLLDYGWRSDCPVLGVCRGMQMMAVWAGSQLKTVEGHVRTRHHLTGLISGEANSFHHQSLESCPADFEVLARSEDGEIEAIRHAQRPFEGWMWHPERESEFSARDVARLTGLLRG